MLLLPTAVRLTLIMYSPLPWRLTNNDRRSSTDDRRSCHVPRLAHRKRALSKMAVASARARARVRDDGGRHYAGRTCARAAGACASERAQCGGDRDAVLTRSRTLMNSLQRPQEIKSKNQKAICRRSLPQPDDSCGVDAESAATGAAGTARGWTRRSEIKAG